MICDPGSDIPEHEDTINLCKAIISESALRESVEMAQDVKKMLDTRMRRRKKCVFKTGTVGKVTYLFTSFKTRKHSLQ